MPEKPWSPYVVEHWFIYHACVNAIASWNRTLVLEKHLLCTKGVLQLVSKDFASYHETICTLISLHIHLLSVQKPDWPCLYISWCLMILLLYQLREFLMSGYHDRDRLWKNMIGLYQS